MQTDEVQDIAEALGREVLTTSTLAGGFSHETSLLTLTDGRVVARLGGPDPAIEAAVMATARRYVPVPEVLLVLAAVGAQARPAMVIEYVPGTPLSDVLAADDSRGSAMGELGAEVGRVSAGVAAVTFDRPGFFADAGLTPAPQPPWSAQLTGFAESCMTATPEARLDAATRRAWAGLCAKHAPSLVRVDDQARLAHADLNPKNILVSRAGAGWRVDALLDWEFSYAGSPYGDAANMARFGADYPPAFRTGFGTAFAACQPADLPPPEDWAYLGRVLDMFALSDLVTRRLGHPVADRVALQIKSWLANGVPRTT